MAGTLLRSRCGEVSGSRRLCELQITTMRQRFAKEVVPFVVEFEVAVPRLTPAFW